MLGLKTNALESEEGNMFEGKRTPFVVISDQINSCTGFTFPSSLKEFSGSTFLDMLFTVTRGEPAESIKRDTFDVEMTLLSLVLAVNENTYNVLEIKLDFDTIASRDSEELMVMKHLELLQNSQAHSNRKSTKFAPSLSIEGDESKRRSESSTKVPFPPLIFRTGKLLLGMILTLSKFCRVPEVTVNVTSYVDASEKVYSGTVKEDPVNVIRTIEFNELVICQKKSNEADDPHAAEAVPISSKP